MKIARVEAIPLALPIAGGQGPFLFGRPRTALEFLVVRVETEDGIVGWGEGGQLWACRALQAIVEDMIAPAAVGHDASDIAELMIQLQWMAFASRSGLAMSALAGLEIALWDVAGKALGAPLSRLLGAGAGRPLVPYASLSPLPDPAMTADHARRAFDAGYRHLKIHASQSTRPGLGGEAHARAIREALGDDVRIMVDGVYDRRAALRLKAFDIDWLEEPVAPPDDYAALARLRAETGIDTAAGECVHTLHEFRAMLSAGAVAYAQPCVYKVGGVIEYRKIAALAEAHGVALTPHSYSVGPGFIATQHLLAAQPNAGLLEKPFGELEGDPWGVAGHPVDGALRAPDGPGLGRDPDPDAIREFRLRG